RSPSLRRRSRRPSVTIQRKMGSRRQHSVNHFGPILRKPSIGKEPGKLKKKCLQQLQRTQQSFRVAYNHANERGDDNVIRRPQQNNVATKKHPNFLLRSLAMLRQCLDKMSRHILHGQRKVRVLHGKMLRSPNPLSLGLSKRIPRRLAHLAQCLTVALILCKRMLPSVDPLPLC
uniref:Uncharacterized protein n=1 Tax=Aegilops tauschii subsp. strangulata TaxID=200361 RepID=A0A453RKV0_AEGTS